MIRIQGYNNNKKGIQETFEILLIKYDLLLTYINLIIILGGCVINDKLSSDVGNDNNILRF